jgi:hypothetical protein
MMTLEEAGWMHFLNSGRSPLFVRYLIAVWEDWRVAEYDRLQNGIMISGLRHQPLRVELSFGRG